MGEDQTSRTRDKEIVSDFARIEDLCRQLNVVLIRMNVYDENITVQRDNDFSNLLNARNAKIVEAGYLLTKMGLADEGMRQHAGFLEMNAKLK